MTVPATDLDRETMDRMVSENLGLVHHVARQLGNAYAKQADFDELVSAGTMGLIRAVESFDASRGVAFSTYAAPRIRGAIQDEMRRVDPVPRSVRRKGRQLAVARTFLIGELGRHPSPAELAAHLGLDEATLWAWEAEVDRSAQVSLDEPAEQDSQRRPIADSLGSASLEDIVHDRLTAAEELAAMREAILELSEQDRTVLALYYFEELKLHEIATVLGLTESRISQIRTRALGRMRSKLAPLRDL